MRYIRWVRASSERYLLCEYKDGSFLLVRLDDDADVFFKGDDASRVDNDILALDLKHEYGDAFTEAFNRWASDYDEVMTTPDVEG